MSLKMTKNNEKITVVTAITSGNDELREDFPKSKAKYVAFLDEDSMIEAVGNELWDVRQCNNKYPESRRNAKIYKVVPHWFVETDISIWLDGNISLNITPEELVALWLRDEDIAVCKHFERTCLYEEAEVCKTCQLDDPVLINKQMKRYRAAGYPENNGMAECGVIIRRHTPEIEKLSEKWWDEICKGSSRDQLSFNYVFKNVSMMNANARYNPLFNYHEHLKPSSNEYTKYYV